MSSASSRRARDAHAHVHLLSCLVLLALGAGACARGPAVRFEQGARALTVKRPALYPETIAHNPRTDKFLLGSFREGAIYQVEQDGSVARLVDDPRLCSVLGIAVDSARGRLWALSSDLGASLKPSPGGAKSLAAVAVYDLTRGKPLYYVDLAGLAEGPHLANGIALDAAGNAYVTDSFAPAVYKVDAQGRASLFVSSPQFAGEGISLNGVVVHPDGYLLLIKKSDGALFKVPLADPARFSRVRVEKPLVGGDGLTLIGTNELIVIANQTPELAANAAYALASEDDWQSAKLRSVQKLGDVYPTTAVLRGDTVYVVASKLNELIEAAPEQKAQLREQATIQAIAKVRL
jgi:hypothetical protein